VQERFDEIDAEEFLAAVAEVNPRLAIDTKYLVDLMTGYASLHSIQASHFIEHVENIFAGAPHAEGGLLLLPGPDAEPVCLRDIVLSAFREATKGICGMG
jgi:hypothetical protein